MTFYIHALNAEPLPLISQARNYRVRGKRATPPKPKEQPQEPNTTPQGQTGTTANGTYADPSNSEQNGKDVEPSNGVDGFQPDNSAPQSSVSQDGNRAIKVWHEGNEVSVEVEVTYEPGVSDFIYVYPQDEAHNRLRVRVAMSHPLIPSNCGTTPCLLIVITQLAASIALSENLARNSGIKQVGAVRRYVNDILRESTQA